MDSFVSICIPTYNNEAYIRDTLLSVLAQTYRNMEIIVVDDCSSDRTVEIVEEIMKQDARIILHKNERNLGMTGNWNKCLSMAAGDYVKLICADDMIDRMSLEKEVSAMKNNPTVNLVESDTRLVDSNGKKTGVFRRYPGSGVISGKKVAKASLILKNFFGAPVNNLMRRTVLAGTGGFDPAFTYILDFDLWVRLACSGDIYIIHEVLNSFRIRNDSNTGDLIRNKRAVYLAEHRRLLQKYKTAGPLKINAAAIACSIIVRKLRNVLIDIYLKIFAK